MQMDWFSMLFLSLPPPPDLNDVRLCIQLLHEQVVPQDVGSYFAVAQRTGCVCNSDPSTSVVNFSGNLSSVLAALSYMVLY
jgi:hypothetical protein